MKASGDGLRERDARTYARHGWAKELGRLTLHDQPPRSQLIYGMFGSCEPYSWHCSDMLHPVPHCLSSILACIDSTTYISTVLPADKCDAPPMPKSIIVKDSQE